ncbi:dihydropteroate synthase [Kocuria sp. TGY1127_2]|uniref:dihydropteroate synthase n=1 Tax=Kocuria sp. TGY1127_2 TaxID=2711328 RepID=UPI001FAC4359|nr:dihydropteroate synthase [Kocuria sp. TGY1127_2]
MNAPVASFGGPGDASSVPPESSAARGWGSFADLPQDRTLVMGILNVTPDSFSDGGEHDDTSRAVSHALKLVAQGADIVDVGGESTRPGATPVAASTERQRILPVIDELVARDIVVSVDTMHASTAQAAVEAGAHIINDVSGERVEDAMIDVVRESGVPYILMHSRGDSRSMDRLAHYQNTVEDVRAELIQWRQRLLDAGIAPGQILVDPGLGFAKSGDQDWELLARMDRIADIGHPVLIAASRKRFIGTLMAQARATFPEPLGETSQKVPRPSERDASTAAISALAAERGAWAVRVHDVASTRDAVEVTRKLLAIKAVSDAS